MIDTRMDAKIVKICSMGLYPKHLGKSISELSTYFLTMVNKTHNFLIER
jgi:hypothetical protein